jgi:DNA-binding FadR family transcriptional regulator
MHIPILEAIAAGDAVAARESMRAHMERASRRLHQAVAVDSEAKGSA